MRAKRILNLALGLFVLAAVAMVAWQARPGRAGAVAIAVTPAVVSEATTPLVEKPVAASVAPTAIANTTTREEISREDSPVNATRKRPVASRRSAGADVKTPAHKIVAMYFHGDVRCVTCRKVEAYAKEAVESGFARQVAAGEVEFRPVNVEQPENRHYIDDYQLTNKSVVVVDEVGGSVARWVKLDNVWGLVGDHDAYLVYVQDAVRAYVEN